MAKSLMKFIAKAVVPLLWLVGLLILIIGCVAISLAQQPKVQHMTIVIVVFILFMAALGALLHFASAQSTADEYDVEKQTKAGKENQAYISEGTAPTLPATRPTSSAGGKWANNYVPYGDFPQGSKEDVVNGTSGGLEKTDSEKNGGGEKWRTNYVPYEEEYNNQ